MEKMIREQIAGPSEAAEFSLRGLLAPLWVVSLSIVATPAFLGV